MKRGSSRASASRSLWWMRIWGESGQGECGESVRGFLAGLRCRRNERSAKERECVLAAGVVEISVYGFGVR